MGRAQRSADAIRELPGGKLLSGHASRMRGDRLALADAVWRTCGELGRVRVGYLRFVYAFTPELMQEVLVDKADAFVKAPGLRVIARQVLGDGLLTAEGEPWRRRRKLLAPIFARHRLAHFADTMVRGTDRGLERFHDGAVLALDHELMRITLTIVADALFGADSFDDADDVGRAMDEVQEGFNLKVSSLPTPLWVPTPSNRRLQRALDVLDAKVTRIIEDRRARPTPTDDLLNLLLHARDEEGRGLSPIEVRDEVMTLFLAGHETTAVLLGWAFQLLGQNPAIYDAVLAEVDALSGETPSYGNLERLDLIKRCLEEAMRLFPPAYMFGRTAQRDVDLTGLSLKAGQTILFSPWVMHRRADLWPDPERFDPDRFTAEQVAARPKFHYAPFGGGPRICIGNHFALMEATLVVARISQRFRLELVEAAVPRPHVTLKPGGLKMRVLAR